MAVHLPDPVNANDDGIRCSSHLATILSANQKQPKDKPEKNTPEKEGVPIEDCYDEDDDEERVNDDSMYPNGDIGLFKLLKVPRYT